MLAPFAGVLSASCLKVAVERVAARVAAETAVVERAAVRAAGARVAVEKAVAAKWQWRGRRS